MPVSRINLTLPDRPSITVVLSTWNRGRHIIPTLESALLQNFSDLEILIVGDCCDDDTGNTLQPHLSDHVKWINLARHSGSQSFPNNVGIAAARGEYIAYLGHDDIWTKDHLASLVATITEGEGCDIAVAGCIYHGPPDSDYQLVTGLFESDDEKFVHFFPPSSVMHRRDVMRLIGLWRAPNRIRPPVDAEFILRAARAGLRFRSTGSISVHKFAAGHRYLYYLDQTSHEQAAMLGFLDSPQSGPWLAEIVSRSKAENRFMIARHADYSLLEKGKLAALNRGNKGLELPTLQPLASQTTLTQQSDSRALDWHPLEDGKNYRWSGPNPRPKILIPYGADFLVHFKLEFAFLSNDTLKNLDIKLNGQPVKWRFRGAKSQAATVEFKGALKPDGYSVIELHAFQGKAGDHSRLLALGNVVLTPVSNAVSIQSVFRGLFERWTQPL